jgi:hypothetical protein
MKHHYPTLSRRLVPVTPANFGYREFTLYGSCEGNVMINVTHLHGRMVGGLSLLVLDETK